MATAPDLRRIALSKLLMPCLVLALALGDCGGHRTFVMRTCPTYAADSNCLVNRGCPPPAAIPPCPAGLVAAPLDEALAHAAATALGQASAPIPRGRVAIRAQLHHGDGSCTLLGCGGCCCNKCGASLALGSESDLRDSDYQRMRRTTVQVHGPELSCGGDESLICCKVDAHGQQVVAEGTLALYGSTWLLEGAQVCIPPS